MRHTTSRGGARWRALWAALLLAALGGGLWWPTPAHAVPGHIDTLVGENTGQCLDPPRSKSQSYDGGPAAAALLSYNITGLAVDDAGQKLFVAESTKVHFVDVAAGTIRTLPEAVLTPNTGIGGLALDPLGRNLYVAHKDAGRPNVVVSQFTVTGRNPTLTLARSWPIGPAGIGGSLSVAVDGSGQVLLRDAGKNGRVTLLNPPGGAGPKEIVTDIGTDPSGGSTIAVDRAGATLYVSNYKEGFARPTIRRFNVPSGEEDSEWSSPGGALASDPTDGNLFSTGKLRNDLLEIRNDTPTPVVPGSGGGDPIDGPAGQTKLRGPGAIAVDGARNVFVADSDNCVVRMIDKLPKIGEADPEQEEETPGPTSGADNNQQTGGDTSGGAPAGNDQVAPTADVGGAGANADAGQDLNTGVDFANGDFGGYDFGAYDFGNLGFGNFDFGGFGNLPNLDLGGLGVEGADPSAGGGFTIPDLGGATGVAGEAGAGGPGPPAPAAPVPGGQTPAPGPSGAGAPGESARGAVRYSMVPHDGEGSAVVAVTAAGVVAFATCLLVVAAGPSPAAARRRARPRGAY